uniref:Metalloendopeptidase n=1 Tax=Heterorhabditis bacteriophora TaxID=37862 RepID=A0A1I7XPD4_HETBA
MICEEDGSPVYHADSSSAGDNTLGRNIYAKLLNGKSHFTELSLNRFISKMAKLNRLQSDIMKVPVEARDDHEFFDHIMNDNVTRPDLQPYLFEGDIILTDEQMDIILRYDYIYKDYDICSEICLFLITPCVRFAINYRNTEDQLWAKRENSYRPRSQRSLTSSLSLRWSSFPIPYFINTVTGVNQAAVLAGISLWQEETCITFQRQYSRPRRNGFEFILGDSFVLLVIAVYYYIFCSLSYITIVLAFRCSSYIGKVGFTSQLISIGYGCNSLGTVTHEIGHALGFFHEQSRYDRDDYVTILTQNISPNYLSQFTKQSRSNMEDYGVGYDYGSVMHYGQSDFSANIRNTIQTIDSNYQTTIGQRVAPSFMDIKRINLAYCNSTCSTPLSCLHGGYTDPKNCSKCRCPDGFGGNLCEQAASNPPGCGDSNLNASMNMDILSVTGEKTCSFIITAPEGRKVYFGLISFTFAHQIRCEYNYLEIKYRKDMQKVGARFCTSYPRNSLSESNILAIIYKGIPSSGFSLQFRYDPAIPLPTRSSTVSQTTFSTLSTLGTARTDPIASGTPFIIIHNDAYPFYTTINTPLDNNSSSLLKMEQMYGTVWRMWYTI